MRARQTRTTRAGRAPACRGVAATELAVILPLFMLLVLGAADFARFAARSISVANGARAGAGYGIMHPYTTGTESLWTSSMKQVVTNEMQSMFNGQFGASDLNVTYVKTTETGGRWRLKVTVTFPFQTIINWPGIPHTVNITQSVEMRGIR